MSDVVPDRTVELPARRTTGASALIKANRPPAQQPATEPAPLVEPTVPTPATEPVTAPRGQRPAPAKAKATANATANATASGKAQVSVMIDEAVRDRARAALRLAGFYEGVETFADFVEGALLREVERLERQYNDGEPIEPRNTPLRPGRRARA
jgi:hypothetical protein